MPRVTRSPLALSFIICHVSLAHSAFSPRVTITHLSYAACHSSSFCHVAHVTPGELQLQLTSLGEAPARAVLRAIRGSSGHAAAAGKGQLLSSSGPAASKRVSSLREQLAAAVEKVGEGHNGAKAALNAVGKVLGGESESKKESRSSSSSSSKQQSQVSDTTINDGVKGAGSSKSSTASSKDKESNTNKNKKQKKTAEKEQAQTPKEKAEQAQRLAQVAKEARFADDVAAAAAVGAAAAAQAQLETVAAGGVVTDGLGLLSPFARDSGASSIIF